MALGGQLVYLSVRFGNVLGSRGSVLTAFSVGVCVLLKSSIAPYFLAHALICIARPTSPVNGATLRPIFPTIKEKLDFPDDHPMLEHYRYLASVTGVTPKISIPGTALRTAAASVAS